jgi:hypothetical protein
MITIRKNMMAEWKRAWWADDLRKCREIEGHMARYMSVKSLQEALAELERWAREMRRVSICLTGVGA